MIIRTPLSKQPNPDWTEIAVEHPYGKAIATYRAFPGGGSARLAICHCPVDGVGDRLEVAGIEIERNPTTGVWEWVIELRRIEVMEGKL